MAPFSSQLISLARRDDSNTASPTIIVGFCIAGALVAGVAVWLGIILYRRRRNQKMLEERGIGAPSLTIKGVIDEKGYDVEDKDGVKGIFEALNKPKFKSTFSRANLTRSIIMPSKAQVNITVIPASESELHHNSSRIDSRTKEEIMAFHAARGDVPKPFRPFSFALSASASGTPRPSFSNRGSIFSITNSSINPNSSISNRGSVMSVNSVYSVNRNERGISFLSPLHAEYLGNLGGPGAEDGEKVGFDELLPPEPAFTRESMDRDRKKGGPRSSFVQAFSFPAKAPSVANTSTMGMKSFSNRSSVFSISSFQSSFNPGIPSSKRSSLSSVGSTVENIGQKRKIMQMFTPILPDELVIQSGEKVVLIHSFDDGWCVVGRKSKSSSKSLPATNPFSSARAQNHPNAHLQKYLPTTNQSLSPASAASGQDVVQVDLELGTVPAWCFLPPTKGLRSERPVRSSSLGITVNYNDAGYTGNREDVISWSNF